MGVLKLALEELADSPVAWYPMHGQPLSPFTTGSSHLVSVDTFFQTCDDPYPPFGVAYRSYWENGFVWDARADHAAVQDLSGHAIPLAQAAYTLEAWVKLATAPTHLVGVISNWDFGTQVGAMIAFDSDTTPLFYHREHILAGPALDLNTWYHLCATWDGANQRFYVDGVEADSRAETTAPGLSAFDGGMTLLSDFTNLDGGRNFPGYLAHVNQYDSALSAGRVAIRREVFDTRVVWQDSFYRSPNGNTDIDLGPLGDLGTVAPNGEPYIVTGDWDVVLNSDLVRCHDVPLDGSLQTVLFETYVSDGVFDQGATFGTSDRGLVLRHVDGDNCVLLLSRTVGLDYDIELIGRVAGVETIWASTSSTSSAFVVEVVGNTYAVRFETALDLAFSYTDTDNNFLDATVHGVFARQDTGNPADPQVAYIYSITGDVAPFGPVLDGAHIRISHGAVLPPLVLEATHITIAATTVLTPLRLTPAHSRTHRGALTLPVLPPPEFVRSFTVRASSDPDGQNLPIYGHRPADAFDQSYNDTDGTFAHQATYWLSEGHDDPDGADGYPWIECNAHSSEVNIVYFHPWGGNYQVFVSVWENGGWVAPEDGGQGGIIPSPNPSEAIPFVTAFGSNWEGGNPPGSASNQYVLPRTYLADKIRLTFSNLVLAQEGGYRAGARKIIPQLDRTLVFYPALCFTSAPIPAGGSHQVQGYWQVRSDGRIYAFGDARDYQPTSTPSTYRGWVIAFNSTPSGLGYWGLDQYGRMVSYGDAVHYGDLSDSGRSDIVDFAPTSTGLGYWILCRDGTVHSFGDATDHGNATVTGAMPSGAPVAAQSIESHPSTSGYWVLLSDGAVQAFDLPGHGSANRTGFGLTEYVHALRRTSTGAGYWIVSGGGIVQAFGDAVNFGDGVRYPSDNWVKGLAWDIIPNWSTDAGYWVQHADGVLDARGDAQDLAFGSVGEGVSHLRLAGNYSDYADIVKELLLWSGFYLYRDPEASGFPEVYGNIETTGAFSTTELPADMFDKHPVMDAITALKEIVGYIFYVDDEGGARFEAPNWWSLGNYDFTGAPLDIMPEIDERLQLTDYTVTFHDAEARSEIIIASEDPYPTIAGQPGATGTVVTRIVPPSAVDLRGLIKPAMWTNGVFTNPKEQKAMADLIAMHIWFARRAGNVTCIANPLISPNDQVRIFERQTGETFIHYVRGVSTTHDLDNGSYTMTLNTHWLGGVLWNIDPYFFALAGRPQGDGYWQMNAEGSVYAFGSATLYDKNERESQTEVVIGIRSTRTGLGYYTLGVNGKILSYGDAVHYGDLFDANNDVVDMAVTPSGLGYYMLHTDGTVDVFGDAVHYGDALVTGTMPSGEPVLAESIESHPSTPGYWVLLSDGTVTGHNLTAYGSANRDGFGVTEYVATLRCTSTGAGYYIPSGSGIVQAFGDATHLGNAPDHHKSWSYSLVWDMIVGVGASYALQHADGLLDFFAYVDSGAAGNGAVKKNTWVLFNADDPNADADPTRSIPVSSDVVDLVAKMQSKATTEIGVSKFQDGDVTTQKARN